MHGSLPSPYRVKVALQKTRIGWGLYRRWCSRSLSGYVPRVQDYLDRFVSGRSFADIGGMWNIDGEYSFMAEATGATRTVLVDVRAPTEEFERKRAERGSAVEALTHSADDPELPGLLGKVDVVWCSGVLYHHPSPFALLSSLHEIAGDVLILESLTIPEMWSVGQAGVYFPGGGASGARLWDTSKRGGAWPVQAGINAAFDQTDLFTNNFWGLSPSCIRGLLTTVGFDVLETHPSFAGVLRHVFVCRVRT